MQLAVKINHLSFVNLLLDFGANPNCRADYSAGYFTPLTLASENNYFDVLLIYLTKIASLLIDFGADVAAKDKTGLTTLHLAAKNGCLELCNLLISRGCDMNIRDDFGNNSAYWAKKNKHDDVLEFLNPPLHVTANEYKEFQDIFDEFYLGQNAEFKKKNAGKGNKRQPLSKH